MSDGKQFNIDLFQLDDIQVGNAFIKNNSELSALEVDSYTFKTTYTFQPGFNVVVNKIRVIFKTDIAVELKSGEPIDINAGFNIAFFFSYPNLSELITETNPNEAVVDTVLMLNLMNIVYSTSRGIVFSRCQGTILNRAILPVLSPDKMDEIFKIN